MNVDNLLNPRKIICSGELLAPSCVFSAQQYMKISLLNSGPPLFTSCFMEQLGAVLY